MAIDTAEKRLSALNFGRGILLPAPDGTIDAGDKATLLNLYSGFALDPPPIDEAVDLGRWQRRRRTTPLPWLREIFNWPLEPVLT